MTTTGTGTRRRMAKEETRRLILDAAYQLFEANGYKKTTMRKIAAQAGVGLGTIFQHFPDKAFLLVEAFDTDIRDVVATAFDTLPVKDIRKQLLHLAKHLFDCYAKRPRLSLQIIGEVFQTEGAAAAKLKCQMDEFIRMLENLFHEARQRNEISDTIDCHDAALAFWSYYLMCLYIGLWDMGNNLDTQLQQLDRLVCQQLHFPII